MEISSPLSPFIVKGRNHGVGCSIQIPTKNASNLWKWIIKKPIRLWGNFGVTGRPTKDEEDSPTFHPPRTQSEKEEGGGGEGGRWAVFEHIDPPLAAPPLIYPKTHARSSWKSAPGHQKKKRRETPNSASSSSSFFSFAPHHLHTQKKIFIFFPGGWRGDKTRGKRKDGTRLLEYTH